MEKVEENNNIEIKIIILHKNDELLDKEHQDYGFFITMEEMEDSTMEMQKKLATQNKIQTQKPTPFSFSSVKNMVQKATTWFASMVSIYYIGSLLQKFSGLSIYGIYSIYGFYGLYFVFATSLQMIAWSPPETNEKDLKR